MKKKSKGLTIVEVTMVIIVGVLILGAASLYIVRATQTQRIAKEDFLLNQEGRAAYGHLGRYVKMSAYIDLSAGPTGPIALYDYNRNLVGTYSVTTNDLTFTAPAGGTEQFKGVQVTFSSAKGTPNETTELRVNFTRPFVTVAHISTRVASTVSPLGWAEAYGTSSMELPGGFIKIFGEGYVLAGKSEDITTLIKLNDAREIVWAKGYGKAGSDVWGEGVEPTSDGGYIITGKTNAYSPVWNIYLMKTDSSGIFGWGRTYHLGNADANSGTAEELEITESGGYVFLSSFQSTATSWPGDPPAEMYFVKTDSSGAVEEARGCQNQLLGRDFEPTIEEDGYIVLGHAVLSDFWEALGATSDNLFLARVDTSGNLIWAKTFDFMVTDHEGEYPASIKRISKADGSSGYVIIGFLPSLYSGEVYAFVMELDADGTTINWLKTYSLTASGVEVFDISQTPDKGYIIVGDGGATSPYCVPKAFVMKITSTGTVEWAKTFGESGWDWDVLRYVKQNTADGGYEMMGMCMAPLGSGAWDFLFMKVSANGELGETPLFNDITSNINAATLNPASVVITDVTGDITWTTLSPSDSVGSFDESDISINRVTLYPTS